MTNDNSRDELCNMYKYDAHNIGNRIKIAAYGNNITLRELTRRAGVSVNAVQQMSTYGKMPRVDILARIADVLAVSVDSLLDRAAPATTNATTDTTDNAPPSVSIGQAVQTIADYMHISPDYVRGALHLPPDDKSSTL